MKRKYKMRQLPSLRETVEKHGLLAKKSLGQNFLLDMNITEKIIRESLSLQNLPDFSGAHIFEVGSGPGGLTRAILEANPKVLTVIEMDSRCIEIMNEIKEVVGEKLQIVEGNALEFDFSKGEENCLEHIVSNLPYNVSVPLLVGWLRNIHNFQSLTLMFQKEVAQRIMAETSTKSYGRISVIAQLVCKIDKLFDLNPNCFVPAPKIWSSVLLLRPSDNIISPEIFAKVEKITELAFGQRRKMIRQSLKNIANLEDICAKMGIETTLRAENLTPEQYLTLAKSAEI